MLLNHKNLYHCKSEIYIVKFSTQNGGLAHLARAFDWQSRGGRFDPDILHKKRVALICNSFFYGAHFQLSTAIPHAFAFPALVPGFPLQSGAQFRLQTKSVFIQSKAISCRSIEFKQINRNAMSGST